MNHKITSISIQVRNPNRVNVSIDGKYRLSLDVYQVTELGISNGAEVTSEQIALWEEESTFGKLYARALEYCMMRPHSAKEVRDYLWRKTRPVKYASLPKSNIQHPKPTRPALKEQPGISQAIATRVYDRLVVHGYIDDEKFARYWLENRRLAKGASRRMLTVELRKKGVEQSIIDSLLTSSSRSDADEIQKIIAKKRGRYSDDRQLTQYLLRQGFRYDDICAALSEVGSDLAEEIGSETG